MWRTAIVILSLALAGVLAQADGRPQQAASAALVQVQEGLEEKQAASEMHPAGYGNSAEGLTLRGLVATLGIGLLSILFFVPVALVAEYFIRRGGDHYTGAAS